MSPYERIPAEEAPPSPETNHNHQPGMNATESVSNNPAGVPGPNSNSNTTNSTTRHSRIPTNEYIAPSAQPLPSSNITTPTTVQSDIESGTSRTDNDPYTTDSNTHLEEAMLHATIHESTPLMVKRRGGPNVLSIVILTIFVLRLWIEALFEGDVALIVISSIVTVYIDSWIQNRAPCPLCNQYRESQENASSGSVV